MGMVLFRSLVCKTHSQEFGLCVSYWALPLRSYTMFGSDLLGGCLLYVVFLSESNPTLGNFLSKSYHVRDRPLSVSVPLARRSEERRVGRGGGRRCGGGP